MKPVSLFLDEDVRILLAEVLRQRGYDAIHVGEVDRFGIKDSEQLTCAADQGRTLLTHNIRDFLSLDQAYRETGRRHAGIIVSDQVPFRELLRRTLRCLNQRSRKDLENQIVWLHAFKS